MENFDLYSKSWDIETTGSLENNNLTLVEKTFGKYTIVIALNQKKEFVDIVGVKLNQKYIDLSSIKIDNKFIDIDDLYDE